MMNGRAMTAAVLLGALAVTGAWGQSIRLGTNSGSGPAVKLGVRDADGTEALKKERERMRRDCIRHLDKADRLLQAGKYGPACLELQAAKGLLVEPGLAARWSRVASQLNLTGAGQLKVAENYYSRGEYLRALRRYERIAATFRGLPVGARARRRLTQAKNAPEVQAAVKEDRASKLFRLAALPAKSATTRPTTRPAQRADLSADAIEMLKDDGFLRVVDALEKIVKTCSGAPTAEKARRLLDALNADPVTKARLNRLRRNRLADQALAKARTYHQAGLVKKAAKLYQQVVKDFPGTPQAVQAAAQLAVIQATARTP